MKDKQFDELEKAYNKVFQAHHLNFHWLKKYGPNAFEDDGSLLTVTEGVEKIHDGRVFILKTLTYFEIQDQPVFYRWCAIIKKVLDHYDDRFKTTDEEKFRSEKLIQALRQQERERKESVEKILLTHGKNKR